MGLRLKRPEDDLEQQNLVPEVMSEEPIPSEEEPVSPSQEPGSTVAVPAQNDDFDTLFSNYKKEMGNVAKEYEGLDESYQREAGRSQFQTGIAGALQSFGEGLAAITKGSAKGLQTGAETMRNVAQQRLAAEQRKGATLKDRLMLAKQPLGLAQEEKKFRLQSAESEMKFRDIFEKRQKEKRLTDPNSPESTDARNLATNFLDVVAANFKNKGAPDVAEQVLANKEFIKNANALQIKEILDRVEKLKPQTEFGLETRAKENLIEKKLAAQLSVLERRDELRKTAQQDKDKKSASVRAEQLYVDVDKKIQEDIKATQPVREKMTWFMSRLDDAIKGDINAAKEISQEANVLAYLTARSYESKGVFTDNDLINLDQLRGGAGKSWYDTFKNWIAVGWGGTQTKEELERFKEILQRRMPAFENPAAGVRAAYAKTFRDLSEVSGYNVYNQYADKLEKNEPQAPKSTGQVTAPKEYGIDVLTDQTKLAQIPEGQEFIVTTGNKKKIYKKTKDGIEHLRDENVP